MTTPPKQARRMISLLRSTSSRLAGLLALLALLLPGNSANAATVLDQQQLVYNGGTSARTLPGYTVWQSFTAGRTGTLVEIDMGFFNNMSGQGTLRIYSGVGTKGLVLQTLTVPVVGITQTPVTWNAWTVNVAVTAGQQYTFELTPDRLTLPDPYGVAIGANNPYAGGVMGLNDPSGTYPTTFDLVFQTFVADGTALAFTTLPANSGTVGVPYSSVIAAAGGAGSISYSASGLPTGLTLTGDTIAGTPTVPGSFTATLTAADGVGAVQTVQATINITGQSFSATNTTITSVGRNFIVVNGGLNPWDHVFYTPTPAGTTFTGGTTGFALGEIVDYTGTLDAIGACQAITMVVKPAPGPIVISPTTLANASLGVLYSAAITATGGLAPLSLTVSGLSAGLSFDGTNILGTPTALGVDALTIIATDVRGVSQTNVLTLTVVDSMIQFSPVLTTGQVGTPYSANLTANGGYGTIVFGATGLPAGLQLSGNAISGTPAISGSYPVSLTATDSVGTAVVVTLTLLINPAPVANFTVKDEGQGRVTEVGADYIRVGNKIIKFGPTTILNIDDHAKAIYVGDQAEWKGLRDKTTAIVLASKIEIN